MLYNKNIAQYITTWAKRLKAINLLGGVCNCCGASDIFILSFHHIKGKDFDISRNKTRRWSEIKKEIEKCVLLCENCHRDVHNIQKNEKRVHNKQICLTYKNTCCCEQCGYSKNISALEFHHPEDNKKFTITKHKEFRNIKFKSVKDLIDEIKKELNICTTLCANCHRKAHTDIEKFNSLKSIILMRSEMFKETPPKIDRDVIKALKKEGLSNIQISKKLKCAKSTITYALKNNAGGALQGEKIEKLFIKNFSSNKRY